MKLRNFKELHRDMRDNRDIYPKRGSSFEEIAVVNLMDIIYHFNSIKQDIKMSIPLNKTDSIDKLNFFEEKMHEKFDIVESLLKDCNIDYYARNYKDNYIIEDNKWEN